MRRKQVQKLACVAICLPAPLQAFTVVTAPPLSKSHRTAAHRVLPIACAVVASRSGGSKLRASSDSDEREFARVRRGRGRKSERSEGDDTDDVDDDNTQQRSTGFGKDDYLDGDDDDWEYDASAVVGDDEYDDDWQDDDDDEGAEQYDLFGDVLIPNPLLDSMDPDGAAERFPELARDPRFWIDMVLFVAFLDFLSFVGPQDPFLLELPT